MAKASFVTFEDIEHMSESDQNMFYGPQAMLLQCLWDRVSVCVRLNEHQTMIGKVRSFSRDWTLSLMEARLISYDEITEGMVNEPVGEYTLTGDKYQVVIRNEKISEETPYFLEEVVINSRGKKRECEVIELSD